MPLTYFFLLKPIFLGMAGNHQPSHRFGVAHGGIVVSDYTSPNSEQLHLGQIVHRWFSQPDSYPLVN